jgi:hypothetical protein
MSAEARRSSTGSGRGRVLQELRAREALVVSMVSTVDVLWWRSPFGPSRLMPWSRWACELQARRAAEEFGADSEEAIRAIALTSFAYRYIEDGFDEDGRIEWRVDGEQVAALIRESMSRASGLDVPLSLLRSDIATVESEIAWSLSYRIEDYDAVDAVVDARSLFESGVPAISETELDAWDAGVMTVAEWMRDIQERDAPLVDAQLALLAVHSSEMPTDPELQTEMQELAAFVDEVRATVPGSDLSTPVKLLLAEIVIRQLADSSFDSEAALKDLLMRAAASDLDAHERIIFLADVEESLIDLHLESGDLEAASVIAERTVGRLLQYRRSGELEPDAVDDVIRRVMEHRISIAQDQGAVETLIEACAQFFEWLHLGPELGGYGGSDQESHAETIVGIVEEFRDELHNVPGFQELYESVRSI